MRATRAMRRLRLTTLLATVNVGLIVCALAGVALVAIHVLQQFADEQALARVSQAGIAARQAVSHAGDDMLIETQVLAQRPTLYRYIVARDGALLSTYLDQYCRASHISACAVLVGGQPLVTSGTAVDWALLWQTHTPANAVSLRALPGTELLQTAWVPVPLILGAAVMTAQAMDTTYAHQVSAQIALTVSIVDLRAALAQPSSARGALVQRALAHGSGASGYLADPAIYLAVLPLRGPAGDTAAVLETELSAAAIQDSLLHVVQTLLLLTLAVALLAALASLAIGRSLSDPLRKLTQAAARMGTGDLTTPVRPLPGEELGTLAETLEGMRERLQQLTGDLRRQQAEAQAIVTGIVEGVFSVDRDRRIRYLNPQAAALLGITPRQAMGRFCGDVLQPQSANGVRPCEDRCPIVHARARRGARAVEHLALSGGARRTVVITSAAPTDSQQVQVLRDETELEATRRMRDTVLATISHEFQTPLSAQLASIELLLDQLPQLSIDEIRQLVLASQRGTLRLSQLINNLLESVRIEAGKDHIRHQPVALDEVVEEAVEMTQPLLALKGQQVAIELPNALPRIRGDASRLSQVFVNLLANANKFAPAHSVIRVGGHVETEKITLWVDDQGPGLPPLEGRTLFERYVRSAGEEPEQMGMGLGLWIVQSIIERHGGHVDAQWVDGRGTRMSVTVPSEGANDEGVDC